MKTGIKTLQFVQTEGRLMDLPSFSFDLPFLIEKIRYEENRRKEPLNAMTLLHTSSKRVVLVALEAGTEILSYQSDGSIKLQVFEGKVKFRTKSKSVTLDTGQKLMIHEKVKYRVTALEETIFLLTISTRVEN